MKIGRLFAVGCAVLLALVITATLAAADLISFQLTYTGVSGLTVPSDFANGSVSVTADVATFTLTPNTALSGFSGAKAQDFFFNSTVALSSSDFAGLPNGWSVVQVNGDNAGSLGDWQYKIDTTNSSDYVGSLTFTVTASGITSATDFETFTNSLDGTSPYYFAAELNDLSSPAGASSGYFGGDLAADPPSVPEPGTLLLLGSGMLGLAAFRKR
jgi:hypothetical protein